MFVMASLFITTLPRSPNATALASAEPLSGFGL
jgi:hypothetical protein